VVYVLYYKPKVAGLKPDEVNDFFKLPNPSGRTGSGAYSVSNRNKNHNKKNTVSEELSAAGA
jgi:hypothetical protein